jgi:hypothetical protein
MNRAIENLLAAAEAVWAKGTVPGGQWVRLKLAIDEAKAAPEEPNPWKDAVLDALANWPGMDFPIDTPPREILAAVVKMERDAATYFAKEQPAVELEEYETPLIPPTPTCNCAACAMIRGKGR